MTPEILAAVIGPVLGGVVSLFLWQNKKNYEFINSGFRSLDTTTNVIERKLDDLRFNVAKNYVTNDDLANHIKSEEDWHKHMDEQVLTIRKEISDVRLIIETNQLEDNK